MDTSSRSFTRNIAATVWITKRTTATSAVLNWLSERVPNARVNATATSGTEQLSRTADPESIELATIPFAVGAAGVDCEPPLLTKNMTMEEHMATAMERHSSVRHGTVIPISIDHQTRDHLDVAESWQPRIPSICSTIMAHKEKFATHRRAPITSFFIPVVVRIVS